MAVVGLKIDGQAGPLWLDAGGAEGSTDPNTPKNVLTDDTPPMPIADNIWKLKFLWDVTTRAATARISDATSSNVAGPQILQMKFDAQARKYNGVVLGRIATMAPKWSIGVAGEITSLSSIPVRLWLNLPPAGAGDPAPCYLVPAVSPTTKETALVGQFGAFESAQKWTLEPFQTSGPPVQNWIPPVAYTALVVEGNSVESMLVTMWNACIGKEWAKTFAGTLLAWMFEYPGTWTDDPPHDDGVNPIWATHVKTRLYDTVYGPCFVTKQLDFGTGTPPEADPPPKTSGGRPPHKPR
jgi:hypothetical protein